MGEMMAETLRNEFEIEKPIASDPRFKQSVSFGRFENDLLSWERWSSFSQNKYLEEVEKCSTPGSVAMKKAYFEAHYKKIAARKVEIMEEEQRMGEDLFRSDTPCKENSINNDYGTKVEFGTLGVNGITCSMEPDKNLLATTYCTLTEEPYQDRSGVNHQGSSVEGVEEEGDDLPDSPKSSEFEGAVLVSDENQYVEPQAQLEVEFNSTNEDCSYVGFPVQSEHMNVLVQENHLIRSLDPLQQPQQLDIETSCAQKEKHLIRAQDPLEHSQLCNETSHTEQKHVIGSLDLLQQSQQLDIETSYAQEEKQLIGSQHSLEHPHLYIETSHTEAQKHVIGSLDPLQQSHQLDNETGHVQENKSEDSKSKPQREAQKKILCSKDKSAENTKKKPASPTKKITHTSLPRASKPAPASPSISASKLSTRKEISPSVIKKNTMPAVKKKAPSPNSLHMSLCLEPTKSDFALPASTRRSFIMEKMGDKDIVKRAFRAFQNNFSLSKPSIEEKSSASPQLSAERTTRLASSAMTPQKDKERVKAVLNTSSQRRQVGARLKSVSSGTVKGSVEFLTSTKASPSSFGLKGDERAEKRKELSKKLGERSIAKTFERPGLLSKSKEKKDVDIKKLSQSLNFKATPMPDSYRGQRVPKPRGSKVGASTEIHHQPDSGR